MSCVLGIDIGSARSKGILLCEGKILGSREYPSGRDFSVTAENIRKDLLTESELLPEDIENVIATGYGSKVVGFARDTKSDLACHSAGIHSIFPHARTVIDVGDLYSKVFQLDGNGNLQNFILSGKCAGGSGRVLQVISKILHIDINDIGELSLKSKNRIEFSTGCLVFAESEAISRIAEGVSKEDLLAGIHHALASQINGLAERVGIEEPIALTGGGARDQGLIKAIEEVTARQVMVPDEPHMTAALGAAILAAAILAADKKNGA